MNSTILIIDDDPFNIKIISAYLLENGYSVINASDGRSGIEMAREEKPDLILLDILMPRLNGFETCKILKETVDTERIPVIFLTALAESSSIKKAFEAGAVDYVTKPIEFTALLARIKTHLSLSKLNENLEKEVNNKTSELESTNKTLKKLLGDRELLIKEIYHRTKNNMLVISSMLSLHSTYAENADFSRILREIGNKIQSMALVHKKLYQSSDLTTVELREYINDLFDLIRSSYNSHFGKIEFQIDLDEISVSIDMAVSCGIIINELLSNSFKYAFPDYQKGLIIVQLKLLKENTIFLKIADNGIGVQGGIDLEKTGSLGIRTIIGIAENQLLGDIVFKSDEGLSCEIIFPNDI
ncbi:MAG: response regulator [Spirochaetales bacterium]|nr:response regulator [Spirochaetales bacterium]